MTLFHDRLHAGESLAHLLASLHGRDRDRDVVVLGLPRRGVPVAATVARVLHAPLDVLVVRKLGAPGFPEYAIGAIGEDGARVIQKPMIRALKVSDEDLAAIEGAERTELDRRVARFRGRRDRVHVKGRSVVIVDDGIATGSTVLAACEVLRAAGAADILIAAPVAPADTVVRLREVADEVVVLATPDPFDAVGQFYDDFSQTTDDEVLTWLEQART